MLHTPQGLANRVDGDGEVAVGRLGGDGSGERGERDEDDVLTHGDWRWEECVMS